VETCPTKKQMSASSCDLVTGATGLLGSHIAEQLSARGRRVRALVRPGSQTAFLEALGVELIRGDLTDPASCARAVEGAEVVYHSAAKVGDWGPWHEFQTCCIDATRNLAEAASRAGVARFLHISSTSAYGHPAEGGALIDESAAMGQNLWIWDPYTRSKVESEKVLWRFSAEGKLAVTVIRPSWLYGERDRTTTARIVDRLRRGHVRIIGRGDNPLSAVYAGTVAEAALLAAHDPGSAGEAYNITNQGRITQEEFINLFAEACGLPPVVRHVPYKFVYAASFVLEAVGRARRRVQSPLISRYATWLMGRYLEYSTAKAETHLGWRPTLTYRESIGRTVDWYREQEAFRRVGFNLPRPVEGKAG
jgi:2-alkyl-3-oxoalkanoate reductase